MIEWLRVKITVALIRMAMKTCTYGDCYDHLRNAQYFERGLGYGRDQ